MRMLVCSFFSFLAISLLCAPLSAQAGSQDPLAAYVKQMGLKGRAKSAFEKAYRKRQAQLGKWGERHTRFERKRDPYEGRSNLQAEIRKQLEAEQSKLANERSRIEERFDQKIQEILTPQQLRHFQTLQHQQRET